jgi:hypothetical protein
MDTVFYIVSMIVALGLFVLIARNLWLMDKREREQLAEPPDTNAKPPAA